MLISFWLTFHPALCRIFVIGNRYVSLASIQNPPKLIRETGIAQGLMHPHNGKMQLLLSRLNFVVVCGARISF